jgi:hypothetical protein
MAGTVDTRGLRCVEVEKLEHPIWRLTWGIRLIRRDEAAP